MKAQWNEADYYLNQDISERKRKMKNEFNDAEYQRVLAIIQDSILLIANVLLSFTDKERKFVIKEALEIATRLTPPKKIKKGKEK